MYKIYCETCEHRFTISDETFDDFLENEETLMKCPECQSIQVNLIEVAGQKAGY